MIVENIPNINPLTELCAIYFDMDGVVSDLDTTTLKLLAKDGMHYDDISEAREWDGLQPWFKHKAESTDFFALLEPSPYLNEMQDIILSLHGKGNNVQFLTSYGNLKNSHMKRMKMYWLEKNLPLVWDSPGVFLFNGVNDCTDKQLYARRNTFLIDDQFSNCKDFVKSGGASYNYNFNCHDEFLKLMRKKYDV